jgi:methionyl-tRNA formyltransferase
VRWILCGKNDSAVEALEILLDRGDEVWVIGTFGDTGEDGWQRSLVGAATRHGVRCNTPKRINEPAMIAALAGYRPDALLSIQYDQILRGPLLRQIGCRCLNFHFALLPKHRGVSPIAFAVLEGDAEAGVTLHEMLEGIDTGDVFAQSAVAIQPSHSAREVYDQVCLATTELFRDRYPFASEHLGLARAQDDRDASYHKQGDFDFSMRDVDWSRPARELHRWLRAMIFPPFQFPETRLPGHRLTIEAVAGELGPAVPMEPGSIVAKLQAGFEVAAKDGTIRATAVCGSDASARAAIDTLDVGDRFGIVRIDRERSKS